jgi:hypothetical protein
MRRMAAVGEAEIMLRRCTWEPSMPDLAMLALGFALFALALGYAHGCERL